MTHTDPAPQHLVPLTGTTWALWRDAVLRSAGFPAQDILQLCDSEASAVADATPRLEVSAAPYQAAFAAATERSRAAVSAIAREPLFREAVAWQNPSIVITCLDPLLGPGVGDKKARERQARAATYFQRYTLKNDTIGFFGPVTWATLDADQVGFRARPGPELVAERVTHFEVWTIDAVARAFANLPGVEPWL